MGIIKRPDYIIPLKEKGVKPFGLTPSFLGAETQNRTGDTRIFSPLLYRLSYLGAGGTVGKFLDYNIYSSPVKPFLRRIAQSGRPIAGRLERLNPWLVRPGYPVIIPV